MIISTASYPGPPISCQSVSRHRFSALIPLIAILLLALAQTATSQTFTRIETGPVVTDGTGSRSAAWADVNNDGWLDLFVTNGKDGGANNLLYFNQQDGTFEQQFYDATVLDGSPSDGATLADYNNDGWIDAYVATWYNWQNHLYEGTEYGFLQISNQPPAMHASYSEAASWADCDNDGDLDLFVANSGGTNRNRLYYNNGDGSFTNANIMYLTTDAYVSRVGVWGDYDNDGDLDLFVANENGANNSLFENVGNGDFENIGSLIIVTDGGNSWGASWGDIDNDGDLDLFVANNGGQNNFMYINNGDKSFTKLTSGPVVSDPSNSVGSSWVDYDNDGDLDLFVANGYGSAQTNLCYENDGNGAFTKITNAAIVAEVGWSYGCAWGDYDNDGDQDLFVANWLGEAENNHLFRNEIGSTNNWIDIRCIGLVSNRSAVGARVWVQADVNGGSVWQMREVSSQDGYCSQNSLNVEFGLGTADFIETLRIEWPSGLESIYTGVSVNQFLTAVEGRSDLCPALHLSSGDADGDLFTDPCDNCPDEANPDQLDSDIDGVGDACAGCCDDRVGDANSVGGDEPTIGDISVLIDAKFITGTCGGVVDCLGEADINQSGGADPTCDDITIGDIATLIDYLFITGPSLGLPDCV